MSGHLPATPSDADRLESFRIAAEDFAEVLPDVIEVFDNAQDITIIDLFSEYMNSVEDMIRFRGANPDDPFGFPSKGSEAFQRSLDRVPSVRALERRASHLLKLHDPEYEEDAHVRFRPDSVIAWLTCGIDGGAMLLLSWPIERSGGGVRLGDGEAHVFPEFDLAEDMSMHELSSAFRPGSQMADKDRHLGALLVLNTSRVTEWTKHVPGRLFGTPNLVAALPAREIVPGNSLPTQVHEDINSLPRAGTAVTKFVWRCGIPGSTRHHLDDKE